MCATYQCDFRSAEGKLEHARQHIKELDSLIHQFFADPDHRPKLKANLEPQSEYHILRINSVPDLSPLTQQVSLITGDAIHDLRSALDHATWQLACRHADGDPANPTSVKFPVCNPAQGQAHKNPLSLDPSDWNTLHEFMPCRGLNGRADNWSGEYIHQLSLLQYLSNQDKHRKLSLVLLTPNAFSFISTRSTLPPWVIRQGNSIKFHPEGLSHSDPEAVDNDFTHAAANVELGAEVGRMRVPLWNSRPDLEYVGEVTPRVALEGLRPIIPTLNRIVDFVQAILNCIIR